MINKSEVIEFFDHCAPTWDKEMVKDDKKIEQILDNAGVDTGDTVLDVACGTGVMIPYYMDREVASVTGIDISPEMAKIAAKKFSSDTAVSIICGDVETEDFAKNYDEIVVYNAFPHFPEPERLISRLADLLVPGGTLTVAHGMSREAIDAHHNGNASRVSNGLMPVSDLANLFAKHLHVTTVISNDEMYQVVGTK